MEILKNYSLKSHNTFGIDASAEAFAIISSIDELQELLEIRTAKKQINILGGGSNILLTQDLPGLTILNSITGIEHLSQSEDHVLIKSGAGEVWHEFVMYCIARDLAGVENLSLIPGRVGAAPMQNIGAYGIELKEVFHSLEAVEINSGEVVTFDKSACDFGYRSSTFKKENKGQYVIVSVTMKLSKKPSLNTSYGAINQELEAMGVDNLSIAAVSQAVINIRSSKLPDPAVIGNAGSFFKNPVIETSQADSLKKQFPELVSYPAEAGMMKVAAGWLIDQAGWKGKRIGDYGVHDKQALVLVNHGSASGSQIRDLSAQIQADIEKKFGIRLEPEVNIW